jgi:hypothetical protein
MARTGSRSILALGITGGLFPLARWVPTFGKRWERPRLRGLDASLLFILRWFISAGMRS